MKTNIPLHIRQFRSGYRIVVRRFGGTLLLAMTGTSLHAAPMAKPTDAEINTAVVNYLLFDSAVPTNEIDITTSGGIVTLSGTAPNLLAKERATMVAEAIKGVRSAVNTIVVETVKRTDEEIRIDVEAALQTDPVTESSDIKATVINGTVALAGTLESWHEKQLAASVATGVKGVKAVTNNLTVTYKTTRPDSEIVAEIESILKRDVWVVDVQIHTEAKDGKVVLSGSVGSVAVKRRIQSDAWTAGVKAVDDEGLKVEPWAMAGSMRRAHEIVIRSDQEVEQAVQDALRADPRMRSSKVNVTAGNGNVTLSGTVGNLKAMRSAERDARNTVGVSRVSNHLKVRGQAPIPDETIARNVKAALGRDPYVHRYQIGVSSYNGTVKLTGSVDSSYDKIHSDDIASGVNGVTSVRDSLAVDFPDYRYHSWPYSRYDNAPYYYNTRPPWWNRPHANDAEVTSDIEERFYWSPFVNAGDIKISVNGGVATLTGTVGSRREFNIATENAYQGSAHGVLNKLEIK
jgi:osmotically-inducible protein OsmY